MNQVFISYSSRHESVEHCRAVRRLADLLVQAGIPVQFDEYCLQTLPGGPNEGWPRWCEAQTTSSACVLVIPSRGWLAAYNNTAPADSGHGAAYEAALIRQDLYDRKFNNQRIRLAYVDTADPECVPQQLRAWHQFRPFDSDEQFNQLLAWLQSRLKNLRVQTLTVKWPDPLPDFVPDFANRHEKEWPAIRSMLSGLSNRRLVFLEAETGYGKSELVEQSRIYAQRLGIHVADLSFLPGSRVGIEDCFDRLVDELGPYLPSLNDHGRGKHLLLVRDLRALRSPILLIVDAFEKAPAETRDWFYGLLSELESMFAVAVIVAGQSGLVPNDVRWRYLSVHFRLGGISEESHWRPWIERNFPGFNYDIRTLIAISKGVPKTFAEMCRAIASTCKT